MSASSTLKVAALITRNPTTLRPLLPFERAYVQFRDALALKEAKPFSPDAFFKKGSIGLTKWAALHSSLPHSSLEKPALSSKAFLDDLEKDLDNTSSTSESINNNNKTLTSLDRHLPENLFLVVRNTDSNKWELPTTVANKDELLHEAVKRGIESTLGAKMELWAVGKIPVGHIAKSDQDKTFIMKQLILSGQVDLNPKLVSEFAWLTKEELTSKLDKEYFESIKDVI
ncbi:UNVERIFIED_CONTAM: 54S ribosomal protein L17 mitochondrial [Siphonaria sp. JEL0065]|nr:54S ribosomal protein L17 mitochondrial [Siphonaria sp. JEL0065]